MENLSCIKEEAENNLNSLNIVDRIKHKRQTKLILSLDENWNNYNRLTHLISLGVDGVEIQSELEYYQKKEIISKINYYAYENHQYIPIIYDLSYYRVYVKKIKDTNEDEIKLSIGEIVYLVRSREDFYTLKFADLNLNLNNNSSTLELNNNIKEINDLNKEKEIYEVEKQDIPRQALEKSESYFNKNNSNNNLVLDNCSNKLDLVNISINMKKTNSLIEDKKENRAVYIKTEPPIVSNSFKIGTNIHANFGDVSLEVIEVCDNYLKCVTKNSGIISKFMAISVESENHFLKNLFSTSKNKLVKEIEDAISLGVNYLIISVINNPVEEVKQIKELLKFKNSSHIKIIYRVDSPESVQYLEDVLDIIDVVYFSRNYLLIKDSLGKLCFNQKAIVNKCNYNNIPVLISGSVLDTMRNLSFPVRSEIKDLYSIILQGVDGLSISSTNLSGKYPFEILQILNELCSLCEKRVDYSNLFLDILYKAKKPMPTSEATASSSVKTSFNIQANAILCLTDFGKLAKYASKYKPYCPVICITKDKNVAYDLALFRGLFPLVFDNFNDVDLIISCSTEFLITYDIINSDSAFVLLNCLNANEMRVIKPDNLCKDKDSTLNNSNNNMFYINNNNSSNTNLKLKI